MSDDSTIEFDATINRVSTLTDGGKRVELNLSEHAIAAAAAMMEYQRFGAVLHVTMVVTATGGRRRQKKTKPDAFGVTPDAFDDRPEVRS